LSEALVDPRIYPGQGVAKDSSTGEEGVNYLRRLKKTVPEGTPTDTAMRNETKAPAMTKATSNVADASAINWKDRRQSVRLRCSGSVEFRTVGNDVRMWGTLTDISQHGCYVEMNTTFPVGTKVDLILKSFGIRVQTQGEVRATYPSLGMGIRFSEIEPVQRLQLKQLLDALAGQSALSNAVSAEANSKRDTLRAAEANEMKETLRTADPKALLAEIAEFFEKNQTLGRSEFHRVAKRVRRS
jgi:hypothetical protein